MDFDSYSARLADLTEYFDQFLDLHPKKFNKNNFKLQMNLCR